jgi:uncharacterized protein YbjT (DUF2867 family)
MSSIHKVAVAGAGSVGKFVVPALVDAGFEVTVLTRSGSSPELPSSVKTATVDYKDVDSLTKALTGQDALVSTIGAAGLSEQEHLVDAAIAAGVKRYIPSEFGSDTTNPKSQAFPVFKPKIQVADDVEKKVKGTNTTYTFVLTNAFLDYCIDHKLLINLQDKKIDLIDGGESTFTTSPLPFVAKGVVAVLQHPDETANRAVRLHGASLTQKKLLDMGRRVVGQEGWQVTERKGDDIEKQAWEAFKADPKNVMSWVVGFLSRAIMGEGYGGDFSANNDNELLGLKTLNDKEIEEVVRKCA